MLAEVDRGRAVVLDRQLDGASASADGARFRTDTGRVLIDAPYRRSDDPAAKIDANALLGLARTWLKRALPRGRSRV